MFLKRKYFYKNKKYFFLDEEILFLIPQAIYLRKITDQSFGSRFIFLDLDGDKDAVTTWSHSDEHNQVRW